MCLPGLLLTSSTTADASFAPWWGVPVVAGVFLLLGGFLTFIYAHRSEKTKFDRARQETVRKDALDTGLAMLAAGSAIRDFALVNLRRNPADVVFRVAEKGKALVETFTDASRRFSIMMPPDFQDAYEGYMQATLVLLVPPFQRPGQELMLNRQVKHERELVTKLRAMRGLSPLAFSSDADFSSLNVEELVVQGLIQDTESQKDEADKRPRSGER